MASLNCRSLPNDGCGWVVVYKKDGASRSGWGGLREVRMHAGGIYRSHRYAKSLCHNPATTCNLVVWDAEQAEEFMQANMVHLDTKSLADLNYYLGTEVSRKIRRLHDGRSRTEGSHAVLSGPS